MGRCLKKFAANKTHKYKKMYYTSLNCLMTQRQSIT
jgi:hypothetical protein